MAIHELKIAPKWYEDVARWAKNFEVRNCEDREFKVGDTLILREWNRGKYTDRPPLVRKIEYVYKGDGTYGLSEKWCILGMKKEPIVIETKAEEEAKMKEEQAKASGRWEERKVADGNSIEDWQSARCSVCGKYHTTPYFYTFYYYKYCPHCGARMETK